MDIIVERERWIILRKTDGAVMCGLARNYKFQRPESLGEAAIKTYRSKKQAMAAFGRCWADDVFEVEAIKVVESIRTV